MKKKDVLKQLTNNVYLSPFQEQQVVKFLKTIQRQQAYRLITPKSYRSVVFFYDQAVEVTHFHKKAIRVKILSGPQPVPVRMFFPRKTSMSIPYAYAITIQWTHIPLEDLPLLFGDNPTPNYARYLERQDLSNTKVFPAWNPDPKLESLHTPPQRWEF